MPVKYRRLGDFHRYYSGERTAPILTIVIGGNHEASNYLWELYFGGWLAPNIYYLGAAGCVQVGGLVIAGASGIYKFNDYNKGHYERQPYSPGDLRSVYHTRLFEISKLCFLHRPDIFLSHDWPNTIEQYGEVHELIRKKPFFRQEIETSSLGSPPLQSVLMALHPRHWFSAHLHVRYAAKILFDGPSPTKVPTASYLPPIQLHVADEPNPEALEIDDDFDEPPNKAVQDTAKPTAADADITEFLALSKCSPRLDYLEYIDVPSSHDADLSAVPMNERPKLPFAFDSRWLAITKVLQPYFSLQRHQKRVPDHQDSSVCEQIREEQQKFETLAQTDPHALSIWRVQQFAQTAPKKTEQADTRRPCTLLLAYTQPLFSPILRHRRSVHWSRYPTLLILIPMLPIPTANTTAERQGGVSLGTPMRSLKSMRAKTSLPEFRPLHKIGNVNAMQRSLRRMHCRSECAH